MLELMVHTVTAWLWKGINNFSRRQQKECLCRSHHSISKNSCGFIRWYV